MVLQFEGCIDAIQVLLPNYDAVWPFDHSCDHDCGCPDGLVVKNMKTFWGGKQCHVRDSKIKCKESFLGPFSPKLYFRDIQAVKMM
jgi:hypothetical protein